MSPDLFLVIGIILIAFTVPSIISAFSDGRAPRAAAILVMIGGGLIVLAISEKPGGYAIADIPEVFARVVGQYIN